MRNWRGLFVFFVLAVVITAAFVPAFASEETGGMSYTVDFFYGDDGEYHHPGGESMMLSQLFTEPGVPLWTAEVTEAEFSDPSLLSLTHEGTDSRYILLNLLIYPEKSLHLYKSTGQISAAACTAEDCRFSPVCNAGYTVKAER